jgi:amino acid transporter
MLVSSDIIALINYASFAETAVVGTAVAGLLYLRYSQPNLPRPIKVSVYNSIQFPFKCNPFQLNLAIPIIFFLMCIFMVVFPFFDSPSEVIIGVGIILTGIPVYFLFVYWQNKPAFITKPWSMFTYTKTCKLMNCSCFYTHDTKDTLLLSRGKD